MLSSFFVSILICHAKNIRAGMEPDILGPVHHLMFSMVSTMLKGRILVHMVLCVPWRWHLAVNAATSPTASEVFQASGWAGIYKYWSKLQLLGRDGRKHTTTICSENLLILNSQEVSRLTSQTSVCWKCHSDKQISQPQHYSSTDVTDEDDHMVLLVFVQGCSPQHKAVGPQFFSHSCTIHRHLQYMKHLGISNHNQTPKVKLQGKVLPKDPQSSG